MKYMWTVKCIKECECVGGVPLIRCVSKIDVYCCSNIHIAVVTSQVGQEGIDEGLSKNQCKKDCEGGGSDCSNQGPLCQT